MTSHEDTPPGPATGHRPPKGIRARIRDRVRRNWRNSLKTAGGSEKVRKKLLTVMLYFLLCIVMAAIFVGAEYQNDRQNRIKYKNTLHEYVKEISEFSKVMDVVEWRYYAKSKINDIVQMNHELNIGPNYRVEAWSFANAFVFVLSTTTTIGYGHPAPNTTAGRIITIVLCITGIPFAYMALTDFVDLILVIEKFIWLTVKKKGAKPLSAIALYKDMVTQRISQMITHVDKDGRTTGYSAPEIHLPPASRHVSDTVVTRPRPYVSSALATRVTHAQPPKISTPFEEISPAEPAAQKTPSAHVPSSDHEPDSIEKSKDEDDHWEDASYPNKKVKLHRHEITCAGRILACFYENCCEEPPMEEEEEEVYHVEDHLHDGHPKLNDPIPGEEVLHQLHIKTGTVRREIDSDSIKEQSNHVVDGHIHSDTGRSGTKTRTTGETIQSLQSTLKKDLETVQYANKPDSRRGSDQRGSDRRGSEKRGSVGSSRPDTASHERLPAELRFPKSLIHKPSSVCGPTAKYSVDMYGNLDERIQQHRQQQKQIQVAQRHERRVTIMNIHKQEESLRQSQNDLPQPPPTMTPGMAFMIEAGSGMIPTHDHDLCDDLLSNTMTGMMDGIISKVKVELENKETDEREEGPQADEVSEESKAVIAEELEKMTKEAHRYVTLHEQQSTSQPVEQDGAVSQNTGPLELLPRANVEGESDASYTVSENEEASDGEQKKNRPNTAKDVNIELDRNERNRSNSCALLIEDECNNENDNASKQNLPAHPVPLVIRTRSRTSGGQGTTNDRSRRSLEKMSRVTLSTLVEDEEDDDREEVSLAITFLNLLMYIFVGALMFVYGERWDYLTAVYYIFTSISTIGFGDVMPTGGTSLFFWSSLFIFFGLAFLAKVITGIRGAMMKFMVATVDTVERAGVRMVSNISHLSRHTRRVAPHRGDSGTEVQIRAQDMTEENALLIPTHSGAKQMMKVSSLPTTLASRSTSQPRHLHESMARMTPAQTGSLQNALSPIPPTPEPSSSKNPPKNELNVCVGDLDQTESLNIVCSGSMIDIQNKEELAKSRLIMTPMAIESSSIRSVSCDTVNTNHESLKDLPLSPATEEPSMKQRRLSLLLNSEYITEQLSKEEGTFDVVTVKRGDGKQSSTKHTTDNPSVTNPKTSKQSASKPTTAKQSASKPTTAKQSASKPTTAKQSASKPTTAKQSDSKPSTTK